MNDHELDNLFDAARVATPQVPQPLVMRVLEDAQVASPDRFGWRGWLSALGGKRGLGGLITAASVGFWIGVAPPQGLPDLAGLVLGQDFAGATDSDLSLFGWDVEEG